jgi:hypothetical protein
MQARRKIMNGGTVKIRPNHLLATNLALFKPGVAKLYPLYKDVSTNFKIVPSGLQSGQKWLFVISK